MKSNLLYFSKLTVLFLSFSSLVFSSVSKGIDINMMGRWDFKSSKSTSDSKNKSSFSGTDNYLTLSGKVSEDVKYLMRVRFAGYSDGKNEYDETWNSLKYAYVDYQITSKLKARFGKQFLSASGIESDISGSDMYAYSKFNDGLTTLAFGSYYESGVSLEFADSNQVYAIQVTNGEIDDKRNEHTVNLVWFGDLFNSVLRPIVSFAVIPRTAKKVGMETFAIGGSKNELGSLKSSDEVLSIGTRIKLSESMSFELDYIAHSNDDIYVLNDSDQTAKVKSETFILAYRMKFLEQKLQHYAKVFYDEDKAASTLKGKSIGYSAALEYYTSPNFRYHAAYSSNKSKIGLKESDHTVLAGIKFDTNL